MAGARFASADYICTTDAIPQLCLEAVLLARRTSPLRVPLFQRRYCWTQRQLATMLRDVLCIAKRGGAHSFGRIVVSDTAGTVLDGQQRITSALLLASAVRDCLEDAMDQQQREDEDEAIGEAKRCAEEINALLFPWGERPALMWPEAATAAARALREEGAALEQAALLPTFLDRRAYWRCTLPRELLRSFSCSHSSGGGAAVPVSSSSSSDRISHAKAFFVRALRGRRGALVQAAGVAAGHMSPLRQAVRGATLLLRSLMSRCSVLYFAAREADVWSIFERLAFRDAMLAGICATAGGAARAGVFVAECDLVRCFLLSYVGHGDAGDGERVAGGREGGSDGHVGERARARAFLELWRPVEELAAVAVTTQQCCARSSAPAVAQLFDPTALVGSALSTVRGPPPPQDSHSWHRLPGTCAGVGRAELRQRLLQQEQQQRQQRRRPQQQQVLQPAEPSTRLDELLRAFVESRGSDSGAGGHSPPGLPAAPLAIASGRSDCKGGEGPSLPKACGGAVHLGVPEFFPTYQRMRLLVERELQTAGIATTWPPAVEAEQLVLELMQSILQFSRSFF